jgi:hypothetical protein
MQNVVYSRQKRERKKAKEENLREKVQELQAANHRLVSETRCLEGLLSSAQAMAPSIVHTGYAGPGVPALPSSNGTGSLTDTVAPDHPEPQLSGCMAQPLFDRGQLAQLPPFQPERLACEVLLLNSSSTSSTEHLSDDLFFESS